MAVKKDLYLSLAAFMIIACMALPSIMKLSHAIHEHQSQSCSADISLHFHEAEFDCEFQKFKLSQQFYPPIQQYEIYSPTFWIGINSDSYSFLSTYQKLHFSLRGPPNVS